MWMTRARQKSLSSCLILPENTDLPLYFYRDRDAREIDLLIAHDGMLFPIEIKKHADPSKDDIDAFSLLDKIHGVQRGP